MFADFIITTAAAQTPSKISFDERAALSRRKRIMVNFL
jgi:hypothetical protein